MSQHTLGPLGLLYDKDHVAVFYDSQTRIKITVDASETFGFLGGPMVWGRLIAKAPKMLKNLVNLLRLGDSLCDLVDAAKADGDFTESLDNARALLREIEGEAT